MAHPATYQAMELGAYKKYSPHHSNGSAIPVTSQRGQRCGVAAAVKLPPMPAMAKADIPFATPAMLNPCDTPRICRNAQMPPWPTNARAIDTSPTSTSGEGNERLCVAVALSGPAEGGRLTAFKIAAPTA